MSQVHIHIGPDAIGKDARGGAQERCAQVTSPASWLRKRRLRSFLPFSSHCVCPLQANLVVQENRHVLAMQDLQKAQAELDEKQAELDVVQAEYEQAMTEKQVTVLGIRVTVICPPCSLEILIPILPSLSQGLVFTGIHVIYTKYLHSTLSLVLLWTLFLTVPQGFIKMS